MRELRTAPSASADEADLVVLCEQHAPALLTYVAKLIGDRQMAEDIVQETLLRAWTHPNAVAGQTGSAHEWLFTVARNLATDQSRAPRARPQEMPDYLIDLSGLSGDEDLDLAMQSMIVAEALTALTPEHRAVLVQTFHLGRSIAQATAELGIPEGTVKSRAYCACSRCARPWSNGG